MNSQPNYYDIFLKLKSPSDLIEKFQTSEFKDDLKEAQCAFNKHFHGKKSIEVCFDEHSTIHVILIMIKPVERNITAKELTYFSRYLYQEKDWAIYSNEDNKLFITAKPIKQIEKSDVEIYFAEMDLDVTTRYWFSPDNEPDDLGEEEEDDDTLEISEISTDVSLSDSQLMKSVEFLIETKNHGNFKSKNNKRETLEKIHEAIIKYLYS